MLIRLLSASDLDAGLCVRWRQLQNGNPALASPFFSPEFTQAVAAVRPDVRVALLEDAGEVLGFFPHQQARGRGLPVGAHFSDHHGVVAAPEAHWDWAQLLKGAGLAYWRFDHLAASQAPASAWGPRALRRASSPGMDLSQGLAAYHQSRLAAGARSLNEYTRKARRLERTLGPLRFEAQTTERRVFDALLALKLAQYQRTRVPNVLADDWTRALLARIWQTQGPGFGGFLSALFAGDTLVAAHLGMRSATVWHWWFPAYDLSFSAYSPGTQILLLSARAATEAGCQVLDLGKGTESYKQDLANCQLPLVEGWVGRPAAATAVLAVQGEAQRRLAQIRRSPLLQPLKPLAQKLRAAWA